MFYKILGVQNNYTYREMHTEVYKVLSETQKYLNHNSNKFTEICSKLGILNRQTNLNVDFLLSDFIGKIIDMGTQNFAKLFNIGIINYSVVSMSNIFNKIPPSIGFLHYYILEISKKVPVVAKHNCYEVSYTVNQDLLKTQKKSYRVPSAKTILLPATPTNEITYYIYSMIIGDLVKDNNKKNILENRKGTSINTTSPIQFIMKDELKIVNKQNPTLEHYLYIFNLIYMECKKILINLPLEHIKNNMLFLLQYVLFSLFGSYVMWLILHD